MAHYYYEGVLLAEIPEHDEAVYPHKVVVTDGEGKYYLILSDTAFTAKQIDGVWRLYYPTTTVLVPYVYRSYAWSDDVTIIREEATDGTTVVGYYLGGVTCVWTDTDIADGDGNTVYTASEPVLAVAAVPVFSTNLEQGGSYSYGRWIRGDALMVAAESSDGGTVIYQWYKDGEAISGATATSYTPKTNVLGTHTYFCRATNVLVPDTTASADSNSVTVTVTNDGALVSFQLGLAVGLGLKGWYRAAKPVAYLYNGVRLPKLPEWDKSVYPYTVIWKGSISSSTGVRLFFSDVLLERENLFTYVNLIPVLDGSAVAYIVEGEQWVRDTESDKTLTAGLASIQSLGGGAVWSNFDIYYTDDSGSLAGTLALAASEPVPVYE